MKNIAAGSLEDFARNQQLRSQGGLLKLPGYLRSNIKAGFVVDATVFLL